MPITNRERIRLDTDGLAFRDPTGGVESVAPASEPAAELDGMRRPRPDAGEKHMLDGSHRQAPRLRLVAEGELDDPRRREAQAMSGAAQDLRAWAITLPPDSEIRALLLRSAGRFVAASAEELGPHLRLVFPS